MSTTSLSLHRDSSARVAAIIAHAGTCVAWFLAPLIVYLVLPRDSRWARFQAGPCTRATEAPRAVCRRATCTPT